MQGTIKIIIFCGGIFSGFSLSTTLKSVWLYHTDRQVSNIRLYVEPKALGFYKNMPRNQGPRLAGTRQYIENILKFPDFPEGQNCPWGGNPAKGYIGWIQCNPSRIPLALPGLSTLHSLSQCLQATHFFASVRDRSLFMAGGEGSQKWGGVENIFRSKE